MNAEQPWITLRDGDRSFETRPDDLVRFSAPGRSQFVTFGHNSEAALASWQYLPWGPFATEEAMCAQLRSFAGALDRIYYAVRDPITGETFGMATYLDIQPSAGVVEIGSIWFAPTFQRTQAATEALFLMLAYAMDVVIGECNGDAMH